jgi:hypothetical protein
MCYRKFIMTAPLAVASCFFAPQAFATTISGATAYNANSDGSWNHAGITSTSGCCQGINVEQTTFTGLSANYVALPLTLALGTDVLYLESGDWTASFGVSTGGLNLFFNGSSTPGIAAHTTPTFDQNVTPAFTVTGSGLITASLGNTDISSPGSLVFDDGTDTVTLIGLQWVGGSGSNPYSNLFTVQRVTLSVTPDVGRGVPEPGSLLLIGGGLGILAMLRLRRSAA